MADVSYDLARIAGQTLKWQKQPDRMWYGVPAESWKPAAGRIRIGTGEFGPEVDALPSKFTMSLGANRLTLYVRGTKQNPIIDGVGIVGSLEPFKEVLTAWGKEYQDVVTAIGRQQLWDAANPEYTQSSPVRKTVPKSKLSPDQLQA